MTRFTFKLPDIGEGIAEAEIVAWHVAVGARIEEDAPLCDMMTDKATVEMESPVAGIVVELAGEVGEQVPIGAALVQERCFHHLEAPVMRVTGWDTPYPHSLEWAYFPGPVRIGQALKKIMKD